VPQRTPQQRPDDRQAAVDGGARLVDVGQQRRDRAEQGVDGEQAARRLQRTAAQAPAAAPATAWVWPVMVDSHVAKGPQAAPPWDRLAGAGRRQTRGLGRRTGKGPGAASQPHGRRRASPERRETAQNTADARGSDSLVALSA
jgi:hypothetical protein